MPSLLLFAAAKSMSEREMVLTFVLFVLGFPFVLLFKALRYESYSAKGRTIDDGRTLPFTKAEKLSGTPVTITCSGLELHGIILDNKAGRWVLKHVPEILEGTRVYGTGKWSKTSYVYGVFGDPALAKEVREMFHTQMPVEGDITIHVPGLLSRGGKEPYVELNIWGSSGLFFSRLVIGRLDYRSMLDFKGIRPLDNRLASGPIGPIRLERS